VGPGGEQMHVLFLQVGFLTGRGISTNSHIGTQINWSYYQVILISLRKGQYEELMSAL